MKTARIVPLCAGCCAAGFALGFWLRPAPPDVPTIHIVHHTFDANRTAVISQGRTHFSGFPESTFRIIASEARDILQDVLGPPIDDLHIYVTPNPSGFVIHLYSSSRGPQLSKEQSEQLSTRIWNRLTELSSTQPS